MPRLPALKAQQVVKALERAGFIFVRQKGSHRILVKGSIGVTVPMHNKDLKRGTLKHIVKQAGLTLKEFLDLL